MSSRTNPHALLLAAAPAALHVRILTRLAPEVRNDLFGDGTAAGLVAYAVAHGSAADRAVLAGNAAVAPEDLVVLAAHPAEPALAAALFGNRSAPREAMLRVMPLVPDGDLLPRGLSRSDAQLFDTARRASVAVESEHPKVVSAALRLFDGDFLPLCPAVVLRGCLGLLWTVGRETASQALRGIRDQMGGDLSAPVRDAFADPFAPASLGRALACESSPPVLLERLRRCRTRDDAVVQLHAPRGAIDWAFIVEEHRRVPLPVLVLAALACQVGCPQVLRPPLSPTAAPAAASAAAGPPRRWKPAVVTRRQKAVRLDNLADATAEARAHEDYLSGLLTASAILLEGNPASAALGLLTSRGRGGAEGAEHAVAELAGPALGDNPDAWVVALNLLGDFAGTLPELVHTASAVAG